MATYCLLSRRNYSSFSCGVVVSTVACGTVPFTYFARIYLLMYDIQISCGDSIKDRIPT